MNQNYLEEEILGKAYDSRLMKRLLTFVAPYKYFVALSVLLLLLLTLFQLSGPYLVKEGIDRFMIKGYERGLAIIALVFSFILVLEFFTQYVQIWLMQWIGQRIIYDLRVKIFSHLQTLSLSFFDRNPVGRLITRVTTDVETLNQLFTAGIVATFGDIFLLVGIVVVLIKLNWKLALVTFSVLPLLSYATFTFRKRVRQAYRLIRIRIARINAYLQENIMGMTVVQLFNREQKNFQKFDELNKSHTEAHLQTIFYFAIFFPVVEIISAIAIALIIWRGGISVLKGNLTFGMLVAFIQYAQRFFRPISDLSEKYNIMQAAMASSERIFKLLDEKPKITNPKRPRTIRKIRGEIEFKNVWFTYGRTRDSDQEYVLKDVSFKVCAGEKVAIVGATGAGKTSIINLLCRFYDVSRGKILVDGINIKEMPVQQLRSHIGLVLQDVFLFAGNIKNNIRLGNKNITDEDIFRAAQHVHAHKFINRLPNGYDEEVMERGSTLSVGQKQLLAFARALAFNPEILILDEATSSVDTETEMLIQDALQRLMQNRTSIVIAHRLSTIQNADKIIVLHKGSIREMGTHQELLKRQGIYYRLYQLQYAEQDIVRHSLTAIG